MTLDILDLIGQPTWGGKNPDKPSTMLVTFMTPLRADLYPQINAHLPDTLQFVTKGPGNLFTNGYPRTLYSGDRERLTFNGPIFLTHVMLIGDSRNPQGESWAVQCTGYTAPWGATKVDTKGITLPTLNPADTAQPQSRLMARTRREGVGR